MQEVTSGIWRWPAPHPEWQPRHPWAREVASFAVRVGGQLVLIDPLVTAWGGLDELVERSGAERIAVLITIHYHVRSAAPVYRRYSARREVSIHAHASVADRLGPGVPMDAIEVGGPMPAGARAFAIGKPRRRETPLYLPSVRALAFGDAVVGVDGDLRVWEPMDGGKRREWYEQRFLPTLRPLLELDVDHVLVTHGPPAIGDGGDGLRRALDAPPWHFRTG
jgi:hypothetical protein